MLKTIALTCGLLAGLGMASAGDLPVKAPKQTSFLGAFPYDGSGWFVGIGTGGEAEKAQVSTPIAAGASTFAVGGIANGVVGYTWTLGPARWIALEGNLSYATTSAAPACANGAIGCSLASRVSATQRLKYGGDLSMLTSILPDLGSGFPVLPAIPAGVTNPLTHPYVSAFIHESQDSASIGVIDRKKIRVTAGLGMGLLTQFANGTVADSFVEVGMKPDSFTIAPGMIANTGTSVRIGVNILYGVTKN